MADYIALEGLQIDSRLYEFVNEEVLPGTGLPSSRFWSGFAAIVEEMAPRNADLLKRRDQLQALIDSMWSEKRTQGAALQLSAEEHGDFLRGIGYIVAEGKPFEIETENTDPEIATLYGPQLVVPLANARYALNAANARWGSLYDALYGSDAIALEGGLAPQAGYNPARGKAVIEWARDFLDENVPLTQGSHHHATNYHIEQGRLVALIEEEGLVSLKNPDQFIGYQGSAKHPGAIILKNNGLHIMIKIDADHRVGRHDPAEIADIRLEAALTTIMDCEDSVAVVDAADKTALYRNWLGLMQGTLEAQLDRSVRKLAPDITILDPDGAQKQLKGRSLMLVRNVGSLSTTPAVLLRTGDECPETILDAAITALIALHDLKGNGVYRNSATGSIYVVKPKMHGPEEVAFACDLFSRVEELIRLPAYSMKIGIMDEERRTTLNLKECIRAARHRVFFINTGFLDRTGDEIHTCMEAGPVTRKEEMRTQDWMQAYETRNVDIGLECGFPGKAQIGKGMWAAPDQMKAMLESKSAHPEAGANTAWVPSPTAAVLHATHYHKVSVRERQSVIKESGLRAQLSDLLMPPLAQDTNWPEEDIRAELENNCQGLLGYVVRWIDQGIGCSKVPDINNIGLMEDRATLRISSQHLANWLHHGIVSKEQVMETLKQMARVVDQQNAGDPAYRAMSADFDHSIAFQAACDLVFDGRAQPNGYTEPTLHRRRLEFKSSGV